MPRAKSAAATGEKKTTTRTKKTTTPANGNGADSIVATPVNLEESIRQRAYELYESRGRSHGNHETDWFNAEAEVRTRTA